LETRRMRIFHKIYQNLTQIFQEVFCHQPPYKAQYSNKQMFHNKMVIGTKVIP